MEIVYSNEFDCIDGDQASKVFGIYPSVFNDQRGSFTEVLTKKWSNTNLPGWLHEFNWLSQINRSISIPNVCRGMHAQYGMQCQAKLVECVSGLIADFILDARPNSKTFGKLGVFILDSKKANKIFVPKGFLHGFYSFKFDLSGKPIHENIFQYYISGGTYSKESEINVRIEDIFPILTEIFSKTTDDTIKLLENEFEFNNVILSEKDKCGQSLDGFLNGVMTLFKNDHIQWYK